MLTDKQIRQWAGNPEPQRLTEATRRMLASFQVKPPVAGEPQPVRLEPVLHYVPGASSARFCDCWLEFSIGTDRLYVLRDIPAFLQAMAAKAPLAFGRQFELQPARAVFDGTSGQLLAMLQRVYAAEAEQSNWSYYEFRSRIFAEGRKFCLTQALLQEFLRLYEGGEVMLSLAGQRAVAAPVRVGRPPVRFGLEAAGSGLRLRLDTQQQSLYALDTDLTYVLHQQTIYRLDREFGELLRPLLRCFSENRSAEVLLPAAVASDFATHVLPAIDAAGVLDMGPALAERFCREPLQRVVYLDRWEAGIGARLEWQYGEIRLNPLTDRPDPLGDGRCLVRDARAELQLLDWLRRQGFEPAGEKLVLADETAVYDFLQAALPRLNELAVVYFAEDFRRLRIQRTARVKAGVRLSAEQDWLELTLDCEGMARQELFELVAAYRLKKRYHRLADGSFLSLESPEFETAATLIEQLDLKAADMEKPVVSLPKYRALYLDSLAKDSGALYLERSSAVRQLVRDVREPQDSDDALPDELSGVLRPYQATGFRWLKSLARHGLGGILADDMGLGKTLQVLALLRDGQAAGRPSLVVAPTSLVFNWQAEAEKFTPSLRVQVVAGLPEERRQQLAESAAADLVVTSYGMLKRDIAQYEQIRFRYCFLDEAQNVKNPQTLSARAVKRLDAGACFALTGTPIENSLTELWSIFDFVLPGYLRNRASFAQRFETPIAKQSDDKALQELGRHIRPFILRRLKRSVLRELPEKIETRLTAPMTDEQRQLYAGWLLSAQREFEEAVGEHGFDSSRIRILALLTRLRQLCCHPSLFVEDYAGGSGKLELLEEIVREAVDGGHRALIFSQFTGLLALIQPVLTAAGIAWHYLDGATPAAERIRLVNSFNAGDRDVFLISLKAGGTGLNLTGADVVIHCDPWWNPAVEDQATDRAYRIGQQNVVQVFKLVAKNTVEEKILALQDKKRALVDALIQPGESFLGQLTEAEIRQLFAG